MDSPPECPGQSTAAADESGRADRRGLGTRLRSASATGLAVLVLAIGEVGAHGGETHASGAHTDGGLLVPAVVLAMGGLVLGASLYLDRAGQLEDWMGRAGVLLGIVGLLVGALLALV